LPGLLPGECPAAHGLSHSKKENKTVANEEIKLTYTVVSNTNVLYEAFFPVFFFAVKLRNGSIANRPPSKKPFREVC
jgi:hypothetical protein